MGSKSFLGILAERGKPVVLPLGKRVERLADRAAGRLKDKQIQENKVPSPKIPFDAPGWYEMLQVKLSDVNIMWMMTMDISASPDYKTITIFVSEIADFLYEINGWLEHLVECQLPAKCIIANEHIFSADPLSEDRIEFRITNTSSKQKDSPVIMQVIVKRKQLVYLLS